MARGMFGRGCDEVFMSAYSNQIRLVIARIKNMGITKFFTPSQLERTFKAELLARDAGTLNAKRGKLEAKA